MVSLVECGGTHGLGQERAPGTARFSVCLTEVKRCVVAYGFKHTSAPTPPLHAHTPLVPRTGLRQSPPVVRLLLEILNETLQQPLASFGRGKQCNKGAQPFVLLSRLQRPLNANLRLMDTRTLLTTVGKDGWAVTACPENENSLLDLAKRIGTLASQPGNQIISILRPRTRTNARPNTTSSLYGLDTFPPHTDFAHWPVPPRLLLFRSIGKPTSTPTLLIDSHTLDLNQRLGPDWQRAVWRVTRVARSFLCSAGLQTTGGYGLRWDPSVMVPHGDVAAKIAPTLSSLFAESIRTVAASVHWTDCQRLLIVDNWRMLHARPAVSPLDEGRALLRIAISEVNGGYAISPNSLDA